MHESQRWRLISYDIRDPDRYRLAHRLINGFGERVQYSVYRCRLDDLQIADLRAKLAAILAKEDDLLIVNLCPGCAGRVVTTKKDEDWDRPPPRFSVVLGRRALRADGVRS